MEYLNKNGIIYYINLDERQDRNIHIMNELEIIFPKELINRVSAVKHKNGAIGCSQSHINTLFKFIKSDKELCIIFEDDFKFLFPKDDTIKILDNILKEDFNVLILSYNGLGVEIDYSFIKNNVAKSFKGGRTTAGYMVNKRYAKTLLNNFLNGVQQLIETGNKQLYAIDMYWHLLQNSENKFCLAVPCLGTQYTNYSDIESMQKDYVQCNTCILLTDFILTDTLFYSLNYDNVNEITIKNIKNKYPHIKYLLRLTNDFYKKINMDTIVQIYKNIVYKNMIKTNESNIFEIILNNNNISLNKTNKIKNNFIMILN